MNKRAIVWFRNDLRLLDNEALTEALSFAEEVIPVFVFDDRIFKARTRYGFEKTGKFRTKFIIECIENLRANLKSKGSNLLVCRGITEDIIFELAHSLKTTRVFCNRERTQEEVDIQDNLEEKLWSIGQEVNYSRGKMLFYTADLPFPVTHTPDHFSTFRKEVEKFVKIRPVLPMPDIFNPPNMDMGWGTIPSLNDFGFEDFCIVKGQGFTGGETAALKQLDYFIWQKQHIKDYKDTRNGLMGWDYSSKLSAWLAQGCISPKTIYHEIKKYEAEKTSNDSTYWLCFELLWRDFFRLMGKKHGNAIFQKQGTIQRHLTDANNDQKLFRIWAEGRTGIPFIDANMAELNHTGFMSNRGRQNVASFLVKDLKINWLMGAEYFESLLIDYDPCSNYGNWNYIAGVGSDTREDRYFNILSQARRYDGQGDYVKYWIPALEDIPSVQIHFPEAVSKEDQETYQCVLGRDYPHPILSTEHWER